mgnify:CR=1 FL=1
MDEILRFYVMRNPHNPSTIIAEKDSYDEAVEVAELNLACVVRVEFEPVEAMIFGDFRTEDDREEQREWTDVDLSEHYGFDTKDT